MLLPTTTTTPKSLTNNLSLITMKGGGGGGGGFIKKVSSSEKQHFFMINNNSSIETHPNRFLLFMGLFIFLASYIYILYTLQLFFPFFHPTHTLNHVSPKPTLSNTTTDCLLVHHHNNQTALNTTTTTTGIQHIVFGIAASANLWDQRKNYIKLWWKSNEMRGFVWLDKPVIVNKDDQENKMVVSISHPPLKISSDISRFAYTNKEGHSSAIRISRILSETIKLGLKDVRWFVMGDDDTFFVADNLVRVLSKYDHNEFYYIGSSSESHEQNIRFSYGMAYGGGGFAVSNGLAKEIVKMQDRCIERYPELYGSDDRMHACMAELGVPLTKEAGFHQFDVYGSPFGLLAAHPVAPLVTMHHLDVIEPIFPVESQAEALKQLKVPMKLDSAALMQQSICYDVKKQWTISVSWGYAVQMIRSIVTPREMEKPLRTFVNWYRNTDPHGFSLNTRPIKNPCENPLVYYLSTASYNSSTGQTVSEYKCHNVSQKLCKLKKKDQVDVGRVVVYKKPDPYIWNKSPRRNCCRILPSKEKGTLFINVGACNEGEYIGL